MDPRRVLTRRSLWGIARAMLGVVAVLITACDRPSPTQSSAMAVTPRRLTAVVGDVVAALAVTVRAGDLPTPLMVTLTPADGVVGGTISLPFGPDRTIDVTAADAFGNVMQEGSVTLTVAQGLQPTVRITLTPRAAGTPIKVTLADYGVVVRPATALIDGSVARTLQFTVTVTDVNGTPVHTPQVDWATMKAAVATVTAGGLVTAVANGLVTIVAVHQGIAGETDVTVTGTGGGAFRLVSLTAGYRHTCALTAAGAAYCWGSNSDHELGDGTGTDRPIPTAVVMPSGVSFASLAAGWSHTCGLSGAGGAYCWGANAVGQLGDGTTVTRLTPTPAIMATLSLASLSADGSTNCGPTVTGPAYCWGDNARGQLGDGTTANRWTPVAGSAPAGVSFASVETGSSHTCGLTATGAAYCWGDNSEGQLGDGSTTSSLTPTAVTMPVGVTFRTLAVSFFHTCGLTAAGTAYCWGYNGAGELGDGTTTDHWTPTPVTGGVAFTSLTTVYLHICGLTAAGTAYCWGDNRYGQVGDGTTDAGRWAPTAVALPAGVSFARLVAGSFHTCGITPAGTTYCWGANTYGQIGDGTETDRWSPTAVGQP